MKGLPTFLLLGRVDTALKQLLSVRLCRLGYSKTNCIQYFRGGGGGKSAVEASLNISFLV